MQEFCFVLFYSKWANRFSSADSRISNVDDEKTVCYRLSCFGRGTVDYLGSLYDCDRNCIVSAPLSSDHNTNVSTSASLPSSGQSQSFTLIIVYVTMTLSGLFVILFLLLQLDIIFCRRSTFTVQSVVLFLVRCTGWQSIRSMCNAENIKQQAKRLSMLTPLMVYIGVLDAFVSCEFTEVRKNMCTVL